MGLMLRIALLLLATTAYAGVYDEPTPPDAPYIYGGGGHDRSTQQLNQMNTNQYNRDVNTYNHNTNMYNKRESEKQFRRDLNQQIKDGYKGMYDD